MKTRMLPLLALALAGFTPYHAMAAEVTISNAQLAEIVADETKVLSIMDSLSATENELSQPLQFPAANLSEQAKVVSYVEELLSAETTVLDEYQTAKITEVTAIQEELIQETNDVLAANRTLYTLLYDSQVAPEVNPQSEKSDLLSILAAEHNAASVLAQKLSLLISSLPTAVAQEVEAQISVWNKIIATTQTMETTTPIQ